MAQVDLAEDLKGRDIAFDAIPLVDISRLVDGSDEASVATALGDAAERVGFLYVTGHGIPDAMVAGMFEQARMFFDRPLDAKMAVHMRNSPVHRGYFPVFEENTDPTLTADLKEGFDIARDLCPDAPEVKAGYPLHGPNQWPAGDAEFRARGEAYFAGLRRLAERLMRGFAIALDLAPDHFADKIDRPMAQLCLLHYPPQSGHIESDTIGCGVHTDYGCLTILAQDSNGGLQVRNTAGEWISAPPVAGAFVVNLGDQMARWTNGRFQATPHRVINTSGRERYSMPFFFDPNWEAEIACLETCRVAGEEPRFAPVQAGPYLQSRFDATFTYRQADEP
jgi:isopenicillin N synthase-like dioxygenase